LDSSSPPPYVFSDAIHRTFSRIPRLAGCKPAAQLSDIPRVREALRVLVDDGLATRLGDRVDVSRAAVRFSAGAGQRCACERQDGRAGSGEGH
jgi:hypothetical protein